LPKKFDGTHQGLAFVKYLASKDAVHFVCQIQFVDGEVQKEGPDTAKIGGGAANDGPSWHELQPLFMLSCCLAVWSFCFKHFYFIETIKSPFLQNNSRQKLQI
jgi:hypothetical protein